MKSDLIIRYEGMKALREKLGPVDAEKFVSILRRDNFDYTKWQRDLWQDKTLDELFSAAAKDRQESEKNN